MRKMTTLKSCLALAAMLAMSLTMAAEQSDRPDVEPCMLYAPLVFDNYDVQPAAHADKGTELYALDAGDGWLQEAMTNSSRTRQTRQRAMILSGQMRRAAVSIPSNIAEGQGRDSMKEFIRFIAVARGSLRELSTQLEICVRVDYLEQSQTVKADNLIEEIDKMLNALANSLIPF